MELLSAKSIKASLLDAKKSLAGAPNESDQANRDRYEKVLRHQDGDAWDYAVITHLGPKATVEAAGTPLPPDKRDLSAWHNDTFVNGPSWEEFTRAIGIDGDSASKSSGSVYSVSYYRPASGHRELLEKMLSEAQMIPVLAMF